ncbi:MAG: pantetheine-phosphate adenylyltransferase [Christensenellales bacterium]
MNKCVYPGSFDPITCGHLDVITRAAAMFDDLTVAVLVNKNKQSSFTVERRMDFIRRSTAHLNGVSVDYFSGLLADYMEERGANIIIRGLRAISDFEYEYQMAAMNSKLAKNVETIFLMTDIANSFLSSSMVNELASFGGNICGLVPDEIVKDVLSKYGR